MASAATISRMLHKGNVLVYFRSSFSSTTRFQFHSPRSRTFSNMRVLISGAGIAGPTLAWFLARSGASVTVVEKAPALLPHGQNVDIQGSARHVIRKMGLMEEVKRHNTTEAGTIFIDPNGRPFAPLPLQKDKTHGSSFTSELEILSRRPGQDLVRRHERRSQD